MAGPSSKVHDTPTYPRSGLFPPEVEDPLVKCETESMVCHPDVCNQGKAKKKVRFENVPAAATSPKPAKKKNKRKQVRSEDEQKELLAQLEAANLLEDYRAAKVCKEDPEDVAQEKRRTRQRLERQVKSVNIPRSQ
jgi:hypothetical protein